MDNPKDKFTDVYDFILTEESSFMTRKIPIASNWNWNMYDHIDKSFLLKNSQFTKGDNDNFGRPYKNIILPIANVNYRSEGFDVKDFELYVDDPDYYDLSLLTRKRHSKWAIDNNIDTAIDESVESYFDYGLILVKDVNETRPQVIDLKADLAFCNQTDVLAGAICLKHNYSLDELQDMDGKWDHNGVISAINNASFSNMDESGKEVKTPNKAVKVYELHGVFPNSWLGSKYFGHEWEDDGKYSRQMHIVCFYGDKDHKNGITLFSGKSKMIFKALKRDKIAKRACGRGGIEELFHAQIWTNYSEIHLQGMLEATSKVITKTTDKRLFQQNKMLSNIKNGQVVLVEDGKTWEQMPIQPFNKVAFDNYVNSWEQNARITGSASEAQLGLSPTSGTPLGTTQIVTSQGEGIHDYRRGQISSFWGEIYRDWILDHISKDLSKGSKWLDDLSLKELDEVAKNFATKKVNSRILDILTNEGKLMTHEERDQLTNQEIDLIKRKGNKHFLEIKKDELSKIPLKVNFSIANKQKNMSAFTEKLNGIFRTVFANPAALQQPGISDLFNDILESAGLNPIDFSSLTSTPQVNVNNPSVPANGAPPTPQIAAMSVN